MSRATATFLVILIAALAIRAVLVLPHENYLGVDGGAYLLSKNAVLGQETSGLTAPGLPRPPLAPGWTLVPFTETLGNDMGYKTWQIVASLVPIVAVFVVARSLFSPWVGVLAALFTAFNFVQGEMLVTGALPLVDFSILLIAIWAIHKQITAPALKWGVLVAVSIGLIPYVNQTTAGIAVIMLPLFLGAMVLYDKNRTWETYRKLGWPLVSGIVLALGAIPWYVSQVPGSGVVRYPGPLLYFEPWWHISWLQAAFYVPLGVYALKVAKAPVIKALGLLLIVSSGLATLLSTDEAIINVFYRSLYLAPLFAMPLLAWAVFRWAHRPIVGNAVRVGAVGLAGFSVFMFIQVFNDQAYYSDFVTPDTVAALNSAEEPTGFVTNAMSLSMWTAAITGKPSNWTSTWEPPPAYQERDYAVRCIMGWVEGCRIYAEAERIQASHVLIDRRYPYISQRSRGIYGAPEQPWPLNASWLEKVYENGHVVLYKIVQEPAETAHATRP